MSYDFVQEILETRTDFFPEVIFDVGANVGQTSERLRIAFPEAIIYAFEPGSKTFEMLCENHEEHPNIKLHQAALDSRSGTANFSSIPGWDGNHIVASNESIKNIEIVKKMTGDEFCAQEEVSSIDFLKIDTEGYDLDVLVGFSDMLKQGKITYLQVECTTNYDNRFHVHLDKFMPFLHPFGYRLFGLYDFYRTIFMTKQPMNGAWFCNAVFVREIENPRLRRDGRN
jgi:FkbM family methyltransferase